MEKEKRTERGHSLEEDYFRRQDAELIEKLREKARLEEIAKAVAEKLQVSDPALLRRVINLGVTRETGPAFLLAPLVQIAWAEGTVTDRERDTVLRHARARGIESDSPAYLQLLKWLRERPADRFFDTALEVIKVGLSVLPAGERDERLRELVRACNEVAAASGGLTRVLGLGSGVSREEESLLDTMTATLRRPTLDA